MWSCAYTIWEYLGLKNIFTSQFFRRFPPSESKKWERNAKQSPKCEKCEKCVDDFTEISSKCKCKCKSKPLHKFRKILTKFWTAFINSWESRKFIYITIAIECASSLEHLENLSQHIEKTWISWNWIWICLSTEFIWKKPIVFASSTKCFVNEMFWIFKESVIKLQQRLFLCIERHHIKSVEKCSTPECTPNEKWVKQEEKEISVQFQKRIQWSPLQFDMRE